MTWEAPRSRKQGFGLAWPGLVRFDLEKGGGVGEKLPADGSLSFEQRIRQAKNIILEGFK